jgi:hypothetical protein
MSQPAFKGFSETIFDNCQTSERIKIPINALKSLQSVLEPEIKKMNDRIMGRVSRAKRQGTNEYNSWAWLYFNTEHPKGYRYSQLTVNMSPSRLYVGVNIKKSSELCTFWDWVRQEKNRPLLEQILASLSGREWLFCPPDSSWDELEPQRYTIGELHDLLLDDSLYWINACFEKKDPILRNHNTVNEILDIIMDLYNIYAISSGNPLSRQPQSKQGIYKREVENDFIKGSTKDDFTSLQETLEFIESLSPTKKQKSHSLPSKRDQYTIRRVSLGYDLKPYSFIQKETNITVYSENEITSFDDSTFSDYVGFLQLLDGISERLKLRSGLLNVMLVDAMSDARYVSDKESQGIFLNLTRYRTNKNWVFWLFAASRELSYMSKHRLNYAFINELRNLLILALTESPNL